MTRKIGYRETKQLNQNLVKLDPDWARGCLDAANQMIEWGLEFNGHIAGDCILAKFNLLKKHQIRESK